MWRQPTQQHLHNMLMNKLIFQHLDIKLAPVISLIAREQVIIFTSCFNTLSYTTATANLCSLQVSKANIITEAAAGCKEPQVSRTLLTEALRIESSVTQTRAEMPR